MDAKNKGILIVLSGPSGVGKDTIINILLQSLDNLKLSVSATTRKPRLGEIDGKDYYFISKEKFNSMIDDERFLEYAEYCGNFYGTPKANIENMLDEGYDVILEIEVEGGLQVKEKFPDSVSIFIVPPAVYALRERLKSRKLDDIGAIEKRIVRAREEIKCAKKYDYIVINNIISDSVKNISKIIASERMKSNRNLYLIDEVLKSE